MEDLQLPTYFTTKTEMGNSRHRFTVKELKGTSYPSEIAVKMSSLSTHYKYNIPTICVSTQT